MTYDYIDTPAALDSLVHRLAVAPLLAADTEAAGYHRYHDTICLVQLSTRENHTFLIDPLALPDLSAIAPVFADPAVETVFHDADFDLRLLRRDLGLEVRGLFDTQLAAAFLGERALGLSALLETHLRVGLPKTFQRADWALRPLPSHLRAYAAADTVHLPALRDRLRQLLIEKARLHWAEEEFRRREAPREAEDDEAGEAFMRIKGARDLKPQGLAILRELHAWREQVARARDMAPFRVAGNQTLVDVSARPPASVEALASVKGVGPGLVKHHGTTLMDAIRRGLAVPDADRPRFAVARRPERDPDLERLVERLKEARSKRAEALDLDPGFLMGRPTLEAVARHHPRTLDQLSAIPGIRAWQVEAVGESLLRVMA